MTAQVDENQCLERFLLTVRWGEAVPQKIESLDKSCGSPICSGVLVEALL